MPSWLGVFQFGIFLALFWVNRSVFLLSNLPRVRVTLWPCCFSFRLFCYDLFVPIFASKIVLVPCHLIIGKSLCILSLTFQFNFFLRSFRTSCFECIVWSSVDIIFLPSFASIFWFISSSCIVCFNCVAFFFFSHIPVFFFSLLSFYYNFSSREFFTSSLADGLSL